ncbi:hypothetical protein VTN00DRAFT_3838 [Thermoascus crustaceus]|uniref:uncharacterized protein n=1 Tax=Thermoascus crustaceus TaxID=5088 RepID=UPI003742BF02
MDDDSASDFESARMFNDDSHSDIDHDMIDADDDMGHEPSDENYTSPEESVLDSSSDNDMEDTEEHPGDPMDGVRDDSQIQKDDRGLFKPSQYMPLPEGGRAPIFLEERPIARPMSRKSRNEGEMEGIRFASSPGTYKREPCFPTCSCSRSPFVAPRKRVLHDEDTQPADVIPDSHRRDALHRFLQQKHRRRTGWQGTEHDKENVDQDANAEATKNAPVCCQQANISKPSHAQAATGQTTTNDEDETAEGSSSYPQTVYPPTVAFENSWPTEGWGRMHELCDAAKQEGVNALKETVHDYIPGGWPAGSKQKLLSVPARDAFWISDSDIDLFRDQVALMSGALPETPSQTSPETVVPISPDGTQIPQVYSFNPEDRRMKDMSVVYDGQGVTLFWRSQWLPLHRIISNALYAPDGMKRTVIKLVQGAMEAANSFKRRALHLFETDQQREPRQRSGPRPRSLRGLSEEERHKEKSRQWREARRGFNPHNKPYDSLPLSFDIPPIPKEKAQDIAPVHPKEKNRISKRDVKRHHMKRPLSTVRDSRMSKKRGRRVPDSSPSSKSFICRIAAGLKGILHRICGTKYPGVSKRLRTEPRHRRSIAKPRRKGEWTSFPDKFVVPWQRYFKPSTPSALARPAERPTTHDVPVPKERDVTEHVAPLKPSARPPVSPRPTKIAEARPEQALRFERPPAAKIVPHVEPALPTELAPYLHPDKIVHEDLVPVTEPVGDQAAARQAQAEIETGLQNGIPEWLKSATPFGKPVSAVELFKPKPPPLAPLREESIFAPEWRKVEELDKEKRREGRIRPEGPAVRPLSAKWEARVKEAMAQPNNRQLGTTLSGDPLTKRDLATCYTRMAWLNDEVINAYLALIVDYLRRSSGNAGRNVQPKFHAFNTFFFSNLRDRGYDSVRRWASRAKIGGEKLLSVDTVFVPVHNSAHWTLMVIRPSARTIEHFDSLGSLSLAHVNKAKEWLRGELGPLYKDEEWSVLPSASPQQDNGSDCGVFLLSTAKAVAVGLEPLSYGAADITLLRKKIVAELMHGRLEGEFDPAGESGEPRL